MGKWGKEPARPLEEDEQSALRSLSSLLDARGFRSDEVVLLGSAWFSSGKQTLRFMAGWLVWVLLRHVLSGCPWEYRDFLGFRVSYEGGEVENGHPVQVHAWSSSVCEEQKNRQPLFILNNYFNEMTASGYLLLNVYKYSYLI